MNKIFLALGLGILVFAACNTTPATPTYKAIMNAANERPALPSTVTGTATTDATLSGTTLTLKIAYTGLTGTPTLAHIHGPADENGTAKPICDFTSAIAAGVGATAGTGTINTTCNLDGTANAALTVANLDAGQLYVNLHTTANGGGEVRGQLKKQ